MAVHSWSFDAPSGVYKNHDMSAQLRRAAIAETKFMQFVRPEAGYGKKQGESITITRVSNLAVPTSAKLTEGVRIPEDALSLSTVAITVSEWGRSVPYTSLADDLSEFNMENVIQMALKDQMKLSLDGAAATAFKASNIKGTPTGVGSISFGAIGTVGSNLNVYHIEQIRDYLFSNLACPPFEGDDYIGIISTKAKRGLMSDPAWEDWHKYTDPQSKYNGEVGRLENIRFVESNNSGALVGSATAGVNSTVLGESIFFGADAVVMAVVSDPELRAAIPQDFGRQKAVAWYGVLEFGLIWNTVAASPVSGEHRVIHVTGN